MALKTINRSVISFNFKMKNTKNKMTPTNAFKTSLYKLILVGCATLPSTIFAQINDGKYEGMMQCGSLLTDTRQGPWTQPVQLKTIGNKVEWLRSDGKFSESGTGTLQSGRVTLTLEGGWSPASNNPSKWRSVAMLSLDGLKLLGPVTIMSTDGKQRYRDCNVSFAFTSVSAVSAKETTTPIVSTVPTKIENQNSISVKQLAQSAIDLAKQTKSILNDVSSQANGNLVSNSAGEPSRTNKNPADGGQLTYREEQKKRQSLEDARNNSGPQPITPDMCLDGVCVEQDLGALAVNLKWNPPDKSESEALKKAPSSLRKSTEDGYRRGSETCEQANKPQWGTRVSKLCDLLIFGFQRTGAELVTFFKENKQPVCVTGNKSFNLTLDTDLGNTRVEVKFNRAGRPTIYLIRKQFTVANKEDQSLIENQINKKHPYGFTSKGTPWGGNVKFINHWGTSSLIYELTARSVIFENPRTGPDEGVCTPERKSISVQ